MRAVRRLVLHGDIPPRVVVDDDVRAGQVQACAARLERDQKDRRPVRVEGADPLDPGLLGRGARDLVVRDLLLVQFRFQELQHPRELREDQCLVLSFHDAAHEFHAHLFFDRIPLVVLVQERRVAADLPDLREFREDLDPAALQVLLGLPAEIFAHAHHLRVVELTLLARPAKARVVDLF